MSFWFWWWGQWGNCLFYALALWFKRGGWVCMTRSPVNKLTSRWTHLGPDGSLLVMTMFVPVSPKKGLMGLLHKIWFRGEFRRIYFKRER